MRSEASSSSPFNWKTGLIALLVGVISFSSLIVLSAFAPELEDRDKAGLHAYSKSALGYNFAVQLLKRTGYAAEISRDPRELDDPYGWGVLVITPAGTRDQTDMKEIYFDRDAPILIVLPKRFGQADQSNTRHQGFTRELVLPPLKGLLEAFSADFELERITPVNRVAWYGVSQTTHFAEDTQILSAGPIDPIIAVHDGTIFGRIENTNVFVLTDPELLNTHGLSDIDNAHLMLKIFDHLTEGDQTYPIIFDTTLHGFETSRNLMKMLFEPPMLGATLFMFAAALLLGWAAFVRFGKMPEAEPQFATGRVTLIDSTTGLFELTGRQPNLAQDYGDVVRRLAVMELGYPDDLSNAQILEILGQAEDRLVEKGEKRPERPSAASVHNNGQLLHFAKAYHQWKRDLSDERE